MRKLLVFLGLFSFALVLVACARSGPSGGALPTPTIDEAKLANPAARYCTDQGFRYETRQDEQGDEYGVCIFDDGAECDAWAYFRGECGQGRAKNLVLNVVAAAGLEDTEKIDILAVKADGPESVTVVTDPETIRALIDPLNRTLPLIPPKRCPALYELRFTLKNGRTRVFHLGLCGLYGDQPCWKGMTINPPPAFVKTFNKLVESSASVNSVISDQ